MKVIRYLLCVWLLLPPYAYGEDVFIEYLGGGYIGELVDGVPHGQGTWTASDGQKYVGEWKGGNSHGQGTYKWTDGTKYVGEWKNGKMHGQGTYTWPDGSKEVGVHKDNKLWEGRKYNQDSNVIATFSAGVKKPTDFGFPPWSTFSSTKGRFSVDAPSGPVETNKAYPSMGVWEFKFEDGGRLLVTFATYESAETRPTGHCNPYLPLDSIDGERIEVSGVEGVQQNLKREDGTIWAGSWTFCFGDRSYQVDIIGGALVIERVRKSFRFHNDDEK